MRGRRWISDLAREVLEVVVARDEVVSHWISTRTPSFHPHGCTTRSCPLTSSALRARGRRLALHAEVLDRLLHVALRLAQGGLGVHDPRPGPLPKLLHVLGRRLVAHLSSRGFADPGAAGACAGSGAAGCCWVGCGWAAAAWALASASAWAASSAARRACSSSSRRPSPLPPGGSAPPRRRVAWPRPGASSSRTPRPPRRSCRPRARTSGSRRRCPGPGSRLEQGRRWNHQPDDRQPQALRLGHRDLLGLEVDHDHGVGQSLHVADAAEVVLELLELGLARHALLGRQQVDCPLSASSRSSWRRSIRFDMVKFVRRPPSQRWFTCGIPQRSATP